MLFPARPQSRRSHSGRSFGNAAQQSLCLRSFVLRIGLGLLSLGLATVASAESPPTIDFAKQIRPILSNYCFKCHGPDDSTREADLRLDDRDSAIQQRDDYRVIFVGAPDQSLLIERILTDDESLKMPPPESGPAPKPNEVELLKQWIREGAKYSDHWAFRPLQADAPPHTNQRDWTRNPIDSWILQSLESKQLPPSAPADRYTLIRRLYFDLLGLVPDQGEVARFVSDTSPQAYAKLVSRVLADPHFAERWGRHWLDQARYADTNGYTVDSERTMWPYRDWVLKAINDDMPFNQFTIEQLAGDMLENATSSQLVATGFHRNTLVNQEGGVDNEQFRNEAMVDRVNTTGAVWLGLTVGCAQCHTHKYDPLTINEYYQLFAFFNQSEDVNSVTPTVMLTSAEQEAQIAAFDQRIREAREALKAYDKQKPSSSAATEIAWNVARIERAESEGGSDLTVQEDGAVLAGGTATASDTYEVTILAVDKPITALRLEALTDASLPKQGPGRAGNGNFVLSEVELAVVGQEPIKWKKALADHSQNGYDIGNAIDGKLDTGWAINVTSGNMNVNRTAKLLLDQPLTSDQPLRVRLRFNHKPAGYTLGKFRIAFTDAPEAAFSTDDPERKRLQAEVNKIEDEKKKVVQNIPAAMVMRDVKKARDNHVLIRGDFLRKGDVVVADTPKVLPKLEKRGETADRLDLARWLVDDRNPLTPRVMINRMWMRMFGKGLVETENDFGMQGTPPTHPQLLDYLALEFRQQDWSQKRIIQQIVMSATYQQSSQSRPDLVQADPLNQLLGRQARLRADAEIVRDISLTASGMLDRRLHGPSVYPPQPEGVYAFTQRAAAWPTSSGGQRYRRGLYTFFMRSAPYPLLTTFDSPRFTTTCTRRGSSNTPLQALTVANDLAFVEFARGLATRIVQTSGTDEVKIREAFQWCVVRPLADDELKHLTAYLQRQRTAFSKNEPAALALIEKTGLKDIAPAEQAAWISLARVLLNLDETITRE